MIFVSKQFSEIAIIANMTGVYLMTPPLAGTAKNMRHKSSLQETTGNGVARRRGEHGETDILV